MASRPEIDAIDHAILDLLQQNARRTVADIAARVNLSAAPVKRRIDRLEQLGVILGYTLLIDHGKLEGSVEAFTELQFVGNTDFDDMVASASEIPEYKSSSPPPATQTRSPASAYTTSNTSSMWSTDYAAQATSPAHEH